MSGSYGGYVRHAARRTAAVADRGNAKYHRTARAVDRVEQDGDRQRLAVDQHAVAIEDDEVGGGHEARPLLFQNRAPIGQCAARVKGGADFRVTAGGYIRPNVGQIEFLMIEVMKRLQLTGKERILDLYAGVGIFSAFIAPRAELVTLVDSYPPAVTDADVNLMDFDNIDVIEGQVEQVLADMIDEDAEYDIALVDPPTSGLGKEVINGLKQLGVKRIVYVSGDPASLARDSKLLISAGYALTDIQPMDLSPQTYYIDSVALFERGY